MVGEIRDLETAKISLEAALTGHFVLSTMHTNDAPAPSRALNEMGIEPFVTGSAVTAVLAQRLVRRLCMHCREPFEATAAELADWRFPPELIRGDSMTLYRKRGCDHCSKGYKGRVGIYQLMQMNEPLRRLATAQADREELERCALQHGMKTLWDDGIAKVADGLTTIDELERVLGLGGQRRPRIRSTAASSSCGLNGFVMYSVAPASKPVARAASSSSAVSRTIGISRVASFACSARATSSPVSSGISTSRITSAGSRSSASCSASSPFAVVSTSYPDRSRREETIETIVLESSAMRINWLAMVADSTLGRKEERLALRRFDADG